MKMRNYIGIARALWYLCAGVLPGFFPLFLVLVFRPIAGILSAAGIVGLAGAALIAPDTQYPRATLIISLLLLGGVIPMLPLLADTLQQLVRFSRFEAMSLLFIGPAVCALTYFGEVAVSLWWQSRRVSAKAS
jgi:hypothetical protein